MFTYCSARRCGFVAGFVLVVAGASPKVDAAHAAEIPDGAQLVAIRVSGGGEATASDRKRHSEIGGDYCADFMTNDAKEFSFRLVGVRDWDTTGPNTLPKALNRACVLHIRALSLAAAGMFAQEVIARRATTDLAPEQAYFHNHLAWRLATCMDESVRDGADALKHAVKACKLAPAKYAKCMYADTLAAAYAECGQFDTAIARQRIALDNCGDDNKGFEQSFRMRLETYRSGEPWREGRNPAILLVPQSLNTSAPDFADG
jgi:hypothetical protein